MNPRWILIRRLRGPAFLLTFGLTALLNQWDILSFGQSWPLYLIVAGVMALLERTALASVPFDPGQPPMGGYPGGYPPQGYQNAPSPYSQGWNQQPRQPETTAIVPVDPNDIHPERSR